VQNDLLANNSAADLRVYAVWFNMYTGDARWRWDGDGLVDSRVAHFWDEQKTVGTWFSSNLTHRGSPTWDFYALYTPDARDLSAPMSMGGTIMSRRDQLGANLEPLLANVPAV
jgi:hypothetical protein